MLDLTAFLLSNVVFFCAAFITSIVGFGYNVIGVPFLTILEGAQTAVSVVSIPSFLNIILIIVRVRISKEGIVPLKETHLVPLLVTAGIGTLLGAYALKALDPAIIRVCLGVLLLVFVATDRLRKNWRPDPRHGRSLALGIGSLTGILNGLAGVAGPTLAPYAYTMRLDKNQFVYYLNVIFFFLSIFQFISYGLAGFYTPERIVFAAGLIPISLLGVYLGIKARSKVSQTFFNRLVLVVLFLTALDLIRRGFNLWT